MTEVIASIFLFKTVRIFRYTCNQKAVEVFFLGGGGEEEYFLYPRYTKINYLHISILLNTFHHALHQLLKELVVVWLNY